jgi:predicted alpha-1,6-mannanase (GH76 family)
LLARIDCAEGREDEWDGDNAVMLIPRARGIRIFAFVLLAAWMCVTARAASPPRLISISRVQPEVDRLQQWYDPDTGRWSTAGWWNAANSLTALVDYSRAARTDAYLPVIEQVFQTNRSKDFLNAWYDDEGWWALAWIDAFDLTGKPEYLAAARTIFDDMTGGWDSTCGGGIWQLHKREYKNAIANELFLSVAAHLANRTTDPALRSKYIAWAQREWTWFQHSGMIEPNHLINDGLKDCQNNHGTEWSYNQGVILGGLVELSRVRGAHPDLADLHEAKQIAFAAMRKLSDKNGVLHDVCEPKCGGDSMQFKGIFVRNLGQLQAIAPDRRFVRFIETNATSILENDRTPDHSLGQVWSDPPASSNAVAQTSAVDALTAALVVERK